MTEGLKKALKACVALLQEFGIEPHEWVLVGPHADLLNAYNIEYHRPTHFHVLLEREKVPWKISKEQESLIEVIPPLDSPFQRRYEKFMAETGHDFDLIVAPKPLKHYTEHFVPHPLSEIEFFQRMAPFGNVEIEDYIFSQFSSDKLERPDVKVYVQTLLDEALQRKEPALIERTKKFASIITKRQRQVRDKESDLLKQFAKTGVIKGSGAFKGVVKGKVHVLEDVETVLKKRVNGIIVIPRVSPKILPAISKAKAWIVDEGGTLSHAAVLARELKIPCVVGTKIATKVLKSGNTVEVDAKRGIVTLLEKAELSTKIPKAQKRS